MRRLRCLAGCLLVLAGAACAPPRSPALPSGTGAPFPGFEAAYDEAVSECRSARTVIAELGLSGRAGGTRLRGSISAGFAAPSSARLEGVAFGRAIFILTAQHQHATLLLLRENRIVRDEPPEAIVEALAGVALTPAELRAAVAGCGLGVETPAGGRMFSDEWAAVDAGDGMTYLRRIEGRWRVGGAARGPLRLVYSDFAQGRPGAIHIRSSSEAPDGEEGSLADITLRISQLEVNVPIEPNAFEIRTPADAVPLSIEELRRTGPLGERGAPQ